MRWYKAAVLTLGLAAMGCESTPSLTPTAINVATDQIQARLDDWERYVNNRMIDSATTLYMDNSALNVGWSNGVRTVGLEEHTAEVQNFYNSIQFVNVVLQNPTVDVISPTVAAVNFRYSIDMQLNDTSRDPYSGLGLQVWIKDSADELWKIQHHMMSRND